MYVKKNFFLIFLNMILQLSERSTLLYVLIENKKYQKYQKFKRCYFYIMLVFLLKTIKFKKKRMMFSLNTSNIFLVFYVYSYSFLFFVRLRWVGLCWWPRKVWNNTYVFVNIKIVFCPSKTCIMTQLWTKKGVLHITLYGCRVKILH